MSRIEFSFCNTSKWSILKHKCFCIKGTLSQCEHCGPITFSDNAIEGRIFQSYNLCLTLTLVNVKNNVNKTSKTFRPRIGLVIFTRDFFLRPSIRRETATRETNTLISQMFTNPLRNHAQRSLVNVFAGVACAEL